MRVKARIVWPPRPWPSSTHGVDEWQYEAAVEALYAQPFFGAPLFEVVDVIAGTEDDLAVDLPDPLPLEAFVV